MANIIKEWHNNHDTLFDYQTWRRWSRPQVSDHGMLPCSQLSTICRNSPPPARASTWILIFKFLTRQWAPWYINRQWRVNFIQRRFYLIYVTHYNFVYSLMPEQFSCSRAFSSSHNKNILWAKTWHTKDNEKIIIKNVIYISTYFFLLLRVQMRYLGLWSRAGWTRHSW